VKGGSGRSQGETGKESRGRCGEKWSPFDRAGIGRGGGGGGGGGPDAERPFKRGSRVNKKERKPSQGMWRPGRGEGEPGVGCG